MFTWTRSFCETEKKLTSLFPMNKPSSPLVKKAPDPFLWSWSKCLKRWPLCSIKEFLVISLPTKFLCLLLIQNKTNAWALNFLWEMSQHYTVLLTCHMDTSNKLLTKIYLQAMTINIGALTSESLFIDFI